MSLLEVRDLRLNFGGLQALVGLSLDLARGETLALVGPNGSGKTSLINCISGMNPPSGGTITLAGRRLVGMAPHLITRLGVARTFQHPRLFPSLSVLDNLMVGRHRHFRSSLLGAFLWRREEEERERRHCQNILESMGLAPWRHHSPSECPYGVQKRVELARALATSPRVLLLDEPMAGLDRDEKQEVSRHLHRLEEEVKAAILIVEHDLGVASQLSARMIALDHGAKIAEGSPEHVQGHLEVAGAYRGES
jgi:branched-chain amino acid transport system ATP-binding protein